MWRQTGGDRQVETCGDRQGDRDGETDMWRQTGAARGDDVLTLSHSVSVDSEELQRLILNADEQHSLDAVRLLLVNCSSAPGSFWEG
ncbi:hypothetical protein EYF80_064841 [Liparis tanakae]|uniref:Uncharacterized protein n=1 Tax=Liparis tanakae TaxID=230148 RepID=A0A4Z2E9U2_9TELE|nr:hypothetical protein EYF80_064841 [Liparis tanakae]